MKTFKVTKDHIKIMKELQVEWNNSNHGAPRINSKDPYGKGNPSISIAELLDWPRNEEGFDEEQLDEAYEIHSDMEAMVQIALQNAEVIPGEYEYDPSTDRWSPTFQAAKETEIDATAEQVKEGEWLGTQTNELPENTDEPIQIKLEDGEIFEGKWHNGGFQTTKGMWVLTDDDKEEIVEFKR